jgi:hypothetical protein
LLNPSKKISKTGKVTRSVIINLLDINEETMKEESADPTKGSPQCDVYLFDDENSDRSLLRFTNRKTLNYKKNGQTIICPFRK